MKKKLVSVLLTAAMVATWQSAVEAEAATAEATVPILTEADPERK